MVDAAGSRRFFERAPAGIAQLRVYEGLYHEVFNETDAQQAFDDMKRWLEPLLVARQQR